jgi:hypothetical protein
VLEKPRPTVEPNLHLERDHGTKEGSDLRREQVSVILRVEGRPLFIV